MYYSQRVIRLFILLTGLAASFSIHAYEHGDWIVRAGPANVNPDDSSSLISLGGVDLAGTSASVEDDTALGISLTYMLSEKIGIELLASTPFEHTINESGVGVGTVGTAKHLPPTISGQYYFLNADSKIQAYIGLGLNYTVFFDEDVSAAFEGALGDSDMALDDSFGLAAQLGADFLLNDNWAINATVWHIDIDTEADINTSVGTVSMDVDIDPWVAMIGVAYKF